MYLLRSFFLNSLSRPQLVDGLHHVLNNIGEFAGVGRPDIDHAQTLSLQPYFFQQVAGGVYSAFGYQIAFFEMAASLFAAGYNYSIRAALKGFQEEINLEPAGAGSPYYPDTGRVLQSCRTCQVGC
jgi:hypothetical protein